MYNTSNNSTRRIVVSQKEHHLAWFSFPIDLFSPQSFIRRKEMGVTVSYRTDVTLFFLTSTFNFAVIINLDLLSFVRYKSQLES